MLKGSCCRYVCRLLRECATLLSRSLCTETWPLGTACEEFYKRFLRITLRTSRLACRIDKNFVIKVADFGLSEDIYCRNYFKQGQVSEEGATVKLPVRWMALESLLDSIFTEKTDVVCARSRVKITTLLFILVVIWCDLLGGV